MNSADHLETYAEGWTKGDAELILQAVNDSFVFDDPRAGRIAKDGFESYFAELTQHVKSIRDGESGVPFMELSEVITSADDDMMTAWCWWAIPGTDIQGSGLIKVGANGVVSERIAYYAPLPG